MKINPNLTGGGNNLYCAPQIELIEIVSEKGFAASDNPLYDNWNPGDVPDDANDLGHY